jgi:hypothetical protein
MELRAFARRTVGRLLAAHEDLGVGAAVLAVVFVQGHALSIPRPERSCSTQAEKI